MTGAELSAVEGGVSGRAMVLTFWPRERRRKRSVEATLEVSGWWAGASEGGSEASSDREGNAVFALSGLPGRSGLWLSALAMLAAGLFFLKTLRKRPPGEGLRWLLDLEAGGARPVLLVAREGREKSRLDEDFLESVDCDREASGWKVEAREKRSMSSEADAGVRMSWRWSAWTSDDDVVR